MNTILKITFTAAVFIFLSGCHHEHNEQLTREEMEQIKSEVKKAAEPLMTGWAALDGSIALQSFSPDMVSCYDTMLLSYDAYAESWKVYTAARSAIMITDLKNDYIILNRELVIDSWVGRVEETLTSGEKITYDPMRYTNLFRKTGGQWRIIFAQSTGVPVVTNPENQ